MKQITTFWNYFKKNEQEIINGFFLGINGDEIYSQFKKKYNNISKRIGFEITKPANNQDKYSIVFTAFGYRKLFPKIIALETQAPPLEYFTVQAFIKPLENTEEYKNGSDKSVIFENYEIKISEIQIALSDYNIATKQLKINLYLPNFNEIKQCENLKLDIDWMVMRVIGEIAFRKHIQQINLHPMPLEPVGLLPLIELPDYITYLYQINSRRKPRKI
ncbi:hypothetical protein [Flavobacterium nackdongense]|jgi:hypothetical protein|uniref:Uncharacterized protein n=1 Tax=Flavobacterium nackdongense TaxID=2547394 RepID=A0A4P6YAP5_9FLAO|nr:hypothetical protein [Flavobacterium nackdongense]QBN17273.1 hypothetical protein E1750_00115 [Flavobacterium nackdongense]